MLTPTHPPHRITVNITASVLGQPESQLRGDSIHLEGITPCCRPHFMTNGGVWVGLCKDQLDNLLSLQDLGHASACDHPRESTKPYGSHLSLHLHTPLAMPCADSLPLGQRTWSHYMSQTLVKHQAALNHRSDNLPPTEALLRTILL